MRLMTPLRTWIWLPMLVGLLRLRTGASLHYYEAHRDDAEKIIQSIHTK